MTFDEPTKPLLAIMDTEGNYTWLPTPKEYSSIPQELTKSSRNARGNLYKYRIAVKKSITVKWAVVTREQKILIDALTAGNKLSVKYFDYTKDPLNGDGGFSYGNFYRGSDYEIQPLTSLKAYTDVNNNTVYDFPYYTISMSLVEF